MNSSEECLVCEDCGHVYYNDSREWPECPECHSVNWREAIDEEEVNMESDM